MPQINGVEVPWDVYNYVQNTGDTSKVAQFAAPVAPSAPTESSAPAAPAAAPAPAANYNGAPPGTVLPGGRVVKAGETVVHDGPNIRIYDKDLPPGGTPRSRISIPQATGQEVRALQAPAVGTPPQANPFPYAEYFNDQAEGRKISAAQVAGQIAYQQGMLQFQDRQLAEQMAARAATEAYQREDLALRAELGRGQLALGQRSQEAQEGLGVANLVAALRGPANAFKQAEVMNGLNNTGLSRSFDALTGRYAPAFQAPQANPQAATLGTMQADMRNAGQTYAQQTGMQLPNPNQIVGRTFMQLPESSQQLELARYESQGWDPNDVLGAINAGRPQFRAPTAGALRA